MKLLTSLFFVLALTVSCAHYGKHSCGSCNKDGASCCKDEKCEDGKCELKDKKAS